MDGNQNILPLAFALVDEEAKDSYSFFFTHLVRHFVAPHARKVCLITDRHKGIIAAVRRFPAFNEPEGCHRYCLRHVCSNFNNHIKNKELKDLCWQAGDAHEMPNHNRVMKKILELDPRAHDWLSSLDPEKWAAAHDGGARCGIMTTNMSECINGVLKSVRRLPICSIVEGTMERVAAYCVKRTKEGDMMIRRNQDLTDYAWKIYDKFKTTSGKGHVKITDQSHFIRQVTVVNSQGTRARKYVVRLNQNQCDCGLWRRFGIPCQHAIKVAIELKQRPKDFVMWYYHMDRYMATFRGHDEFQPIQDEDYWPEATFDLVMTNQVRKVSGAGRPKEIRYPNEMDWGRFNNVPARGSGSRGRNARG